jgi:hypothetical protein
MIVSALPSVASATVEPMPQPSVEMDDDGFGFDDLLDIVNPLQHIPLIGTLYREITGDTIELPARLAGGALFGGLLGFLSSLGTAAFEDLAGESTDQMMMGLFDGDAGLPDPSRAQRAYQAAYSLVD